MNPHQRFLPLSSQPPWQPPPFFFFFSHYRRQPHIIFSFLFFLLQLPSFSSLSLLRQSPQISTDCRHPLIGNDPRPWMRRFSLRPTYFCQSFYKSSLPMGSSNEPSWPNIKSRQTINHLVYQT